MSEQEASQTFGVHRDTITAGRARKEATGDVQARTGSQRGHSPKIVELQQCKPFVDTQGDATVEELAEAWGDVGRMTIGRPLHERGDTHQKRLAGMPHATKR